ncbi:hypothetical protein M3Y97_00944600 [Aphelenchoides bicaudatus]|nr:hypothetical protein M3Y97_00944600 [Aphelenchoides bicaudatus]
MFPQLNLAFVVPEFVITVVCGVLFLFGCVKIIWLLYFPEIIWQIFVTCTLGFFTGYQLVLGFFYSACDEETLMKATADNRLTFVLEYLASGLGLLLLTGLSIYFTVALFRACQFARFYANGQAATKSRIISEFKKGQEV